MKREASLFLGGILFFIPIGLIYAVVSDFEPVGTAAILMVGGLVGIIGGYLWVVSRRIGPRPEDREDAEIDEGAGDIGDFPASSWWPLVCAAGAAICFAALAFGFWLAIPGVLIAGIGVVGWVFQFSRGAYAH